MAAAASEQGNEEEMTPAITDPEQQLEERDAMTHLDYSENVAAEKIRESLREAQALSERICQLLGPADSHRFVTTGDVRRRWLAFMEMELRFIAALLTSTLKLNPQVSAWDMWERVNHSFVDVRRYALHEMEKLVPHALQRVAQCFRPRNLEEYYSYKMIQQLCDINHTCTWYMHLLLTTLRLNTTGGAVSSVFTFRRDQLKLLSLYMIMHRDGDFKFEKDRLILKWIHEGFILPSPGEPNDAKSAYDPKSEAETFFSQLVDRYVITCVASNCKHKNMDETEACQWEFKYQQWRIPDSISAEMGFIFTRPPHVYLSATELVSETSTRIPRRLALHHADSQLLSQLKNMDLSQTRSLSVSGKVSGISLDRFENLVLLDLEGWQHLKDEDLEQVCRSKMIFLRYLSVRNTPVSKLPREIKELLFLQTLDVSYTHITELPCEIKELLFLQTLDASYTQITELPLEVFKLGYLVYLDLRGTRINQLPKQIVGLEGALQYLLVETARAPQDVRRLYKLLTLATVDLTEQPASFVRALGDLCNLRVLAFIWSFHQSTDKDSREALVSSIKKWEKLESLTIHCGLGCSMEFLASLEEFAAPRRLEKFKVTAGRFVTVPRWLNSLELLAFLQITVCNKQTMTDNLKILAGLTKLQCLILGLDFIPGQPLVIQNQGFSNLQRFSLDCVLPWLTFQDGAMPQLTHLQLKFSSGPTTADPVPSGITNLKSIREVTLSYSEWCANSTSVKTTVKAVREQVAKHGYFRLFINGVLDDAVQAVDEVAENTTGTSWSGTYAVPGRDDAQAVDEQAKGVDEFDITEAES